jgi:peptidoglycan hydrolase CwlO-like protein
MGTILILQVMSVTAAVILIIALLIVAGLIGYLTAWFYAKSIYTPIIKKLEDEKIQLNREISGLKDDISKLESKVSGLNSKIEGLEKEIAEKEKEISEKVNEIRELRKKSKE